ncbi:MULTISPECIES: hypothetical protein [unclassified Vibrio]|uniref:hypothetical protein n=1 Tax=unclassified Vibrio TaxID=2614977 RepID=UPI0013611809|nr:MULTISPECIES: hypothetical protein [unclassified Vibrio]NAW59303.1 hypothetical protein [Vibrio sp. V36_P2S2PM302]NAX24985.1 hypothetical protein [Vibrio sp. V38_P2S17PM301]NAX29228.1 hypothetical protein [Vibrio sp. V37_P2S8PM304]
MGVLSQFKRTALWVAGAILILSLLVNYKLFGYTSELMASNKTLGDTITSQETTNHQLAQRISELTDQRTRAQQAADASSHRERDARIRLSDRIEQLEKELKNETCSTVSIAYPADWVSGY